MTSKTNVRDAVVGQCICHRCIEENNLRDPVGLLPLSSSQMILCPTCGNKRCPRASDHRLDCTGSNAPDQPGSIYCRSTPAPSAEASEREAKSKIEEAYCNAHGLDVEFFRNRAYKDDEIFTDFNLYEAGYRACEKLQQRAHPTAQDESLVEEADDWMDVRRSWTNELSDASDLIQRLRNALARQERG